MQSAQPSLTEFHVLLALAGRPRHGYGIIKRAAEQTDGHVRLGPGTLYGAIRRTTAAGWVAEADPPRGESADSRRTAYYRLTPAGRTAVAEAARRMAGVVAVADGLGLLGRGPAAGGAT